ncbi:MAG: ABC transporter ATP-binding protein [Alphaproteobacteria bacterium]|nr:ABC transporter ATP-binding protein [Alphaproteobacteria bacterium]
MNKKNIEINVENVSKQFKEIVALDNITVRFENARLYGLIGPAGAGKTTLFRIMLGLLNANKGAVFYNTKGNRIPFAEIQEDIAYMPQSQSLYADLSVDEHLDFFRKLYGLNDNDYKKKKKELVKLARLEDFLDRPAGKLSGGMYKKLGLICALLRSPKIMFLDEPTNGVDPISRREFWNLLNDAQNKGIMIVMSTAYMDEAERFSDVVLMEYGRILAIGAPDDLLRQYNSRNFDELFLSRGGVND